MGIFQVGIFPGGIFLEPTESLEICDHHFLYSAYAGDAIFLSNKQSILELVKTFYTYFILFWFEAKFYKMCSRGYKFSECGQNGNCSMKSVGLISDTLKILGVHFFYNKALQNEMNVLKFMMDIRST